MSSLKPRGTVLSKIGTIALSSVLTLLIGINSYAGEKITLTCSGTLWTSDLGTIPILDYSFLIDPGQRIVSMSMAPVSSLGKRLRIGTFPIIELTDNSVSFKDTDVESGETWKGNIDRLSGQATVKGWNKNNVEVMLYKLACKRAIPLF